MRTSLPFVLIFTVVFLFLPGKTNAMTLTEAIEKALNNNPQIKASKAETNAVKSKIYQAQSYRNPKLGFTATWAKMNEAPAMEMPELHLGIANIQVPDLPLSRETLSIGALTLSVPLTTSGRIEHGIAQAKAGTEVMEFKTAVIEEEIAFLTIKAYLTAAFAEKVENVNRQAYDTFNEHLRQANRLWEEKQIAKYEVIRAETEVANAKKKLTDTQNARFMAIAVLQNIIGENPGKEVSLDTDITFPALQEHKLYLTFVDEEIKQSNSLNMLHSTDKMLREAELGAKAEHLPTIGAFAAKILYHNDQPFTTPSTIVGLTLNIPLYDGGSSSAKVLQQKALREKNEYDIKSTQNKLLLEAVQHNLEAENALVALESSTKAIELATESLRLAKRRFAEGVGTGIEITDATLALLIAQTNQIQAEYQYTMAVYGLAKISNKLWLVMGIEEKQIKRGYE